MALRYLPYRSSPTITPLEPTLTDTLRTIYGRILGGGTATPPAPGTPAPADTGAYAPEDPAGDLLNQLEGVVPGSGLRAPTRIPTPGRPGGLTTIGTGGRSSDSTTTLFGFRLPEYVSRRLRERRRSGLLAPRR